MSQSIFNHFFCRSVLVLYPRKWFVIYCLMPEKEISLTACVAPLTASGEPNSLMHLRVGQRGKDNCESHLISSFQQFHVFKWTEGERNVRRRQGKIEEEHLSLNTIDFRTWLRFYRSRQPLFVFSKWSHDWSKSADQLYYLQVSQSP